MTLGLWDIIYIMTGIAEGAVCLVLISRTISFLRNEQRFIAAVLFLFAMASLLLSDSYWIVYTLMRPDTRMPLAANEIAENASFLLLAAALDAKFRDNRIFAGWEMLFAAVFAAVCAALWIIWTGEWVQDIVGGIAFGYLLCICARTLKQTEALKKQEWKLLGLCSGVIVILLLAANYAPESAVRPLEILSFILMLAVLFWLLKKALRTVKNGSDTKAGMALSFSLYAWSVSTMFLSYDWVYIAAWFLGFLTLPLMFYAVKREVTAG